MFAFVWSGYRPVSYTHLDVYKRQAPDSGVSGVRESLRKRERCEGFLLARQGVAEYLEAREVG